MKRSRGRSRGRRLIRLTPGRVRAAAVVAAASMLGTLLVGQAAAGAVTGMVLVGLLALRRRHPRWRGW